jgi:hypothetical protein
MRKEMPGENGEWRLREIKKGNRVNYFSKKKEEKNEKKKLGPMGSNFVFPTAGIHGIPWSGPGSGDP